MKKSNYPTFDEATRQYVHRYTMEHVPNWALQQMANGKYPAPHYRTDIEWYKNTKFYPHELCDKNHCYSSGQSWPLGMYLDEPYFKSK